MVGCMNRELRSFDCESAVPRERDEAKAADSPLRMTIGIFVVERLKFPGLKPITWGRFFRWTEVQLPPLKRGAPTENLPTENLQSRATPI